MGSKQYNATYYCVFRNYAAQYNTPTPLPPAQTRQTDASNWTISVETGHLLDLYCGSSGDSEGGKKDDVLKSLCSRDLPLDSTYIHGYYSQFHTDLSG